MKTLVHLACNPHRQVYVITNSQTTGNRRKRKTKMSENEDKKSLLVFQDKTIRRTWHNDEWYFSVVDVVAVLTDSVNPGTYWRKLKQRLN